MAIDHRFPGPINPNKASPTVKNTGFIPASPSDIRIRAPKQPVCAYRVAMNNAWWVAFGAWLGLALVFTMVWAWQLRTRNAGIVDAFWAWTLGLLGPWFAAFSPAEPAVRWMIAILPLAWGLRLGTYLWRRNHGKPEDGRYTALRAEWGAAASRRMWMFFQVQVVFSMLIAVGLWVASRRDTPVPPVALFLTGALWLISVVGEGWADAQLAAFKARPDSKGKVCREGLWRYSRHPNYFFECLHWAAYLPLAWGAGGAWIAIIPPVVMAYLLLKLSGVPATEAQAARSRPDYAEYIRTTNALIPWPPKKSPS